MSPSSSRGERIVESLRAATLVRPIDAANLSGINLTTPRHWVDELTFVRKALDLAELPKAACSATFVEVLDDRTSELSSGPLDAGSVANLLELLSRTRCRQADSAGRVWKSKLFPSAGGTHSIEPLMYVNHCDGLSSGWYRRGVTGIDEVTLPASTLLDDCMVALRSDRLPPGILFAASEPDWLAARYPDGDSLLWRDAGVFLGMAQLAATALGLSSTLVGSVSLVDDTSDSVTGTLGALAVGGRREL